MYLVWGVPGHGGCTWPGGCNWSGGVPAPGGYLVQGMYLVPGGVPGLGGEVLPSVNRMTNRFKNITLPQTSFVGSNKIIF